MAHAYSLYLLSRVRQPYKHAWSSSKDSYTSLLFNTTNLGLLPEAGGILDQDSRLMAYFEEFLEGDNDGFILKINSLH